MITFGRRRNDWVRVCIVIVGLCVYETGVSYFIKRHERRVATQQAAEKARIEAEKPVEISQEDRERGRRVIS